MFITYVSEAVFYFFLPFFLFGFWETASWKRDNRLRYLFTLVVASWGLVYGSTLFKWLIEYRWFGPMILSASPFAGIGLQKINNLLQRNLGGHKATVVICLFLLITGIPKLILAKNNGQIIFKNIGLTMAKEHYPQDQTIKIAGTPATKAPLYLVSFYANLNKPNAICPADNIIVPDKELQNVSQLSLNLAKQGIHYLLVASPPPLASSQHTTLDSTLIKIGVWSHQDTGPLTLYRIPYNQ